MSILVLGAVGILNLVSGVPVAKAGSADCTGRGESGPGNVTYQLPVAAKRPGEAAFTAVDSDVLCATGTLRQFDKAVGFGIHDMTGNGNGFDSFPDETTYRITGSVPGFQAVAASGGLYGTRLRTNGDQFTVEGRPIELLYVPDPSRSCVPMNPTLTFFVGHMDGLARMGVGDPLFGVTSGSNGISWSLPRPGPDGSIEIRAEGCGDSDPSTREGFVESFIPPKALSAVLGIPQAQIAATEDAELNKLFSVKDNGATATSLTFTKEIFQDGDYGVRLVYRLSFSARPASAARASARVSAWVAASAPSAHTVRIQKRASRKPAIARPARPSVTWKALKKKRTVTATVNLSAGTKVTHSISARKLKGKESTKTGTCKPNRAKTKASCRIKLAKGRWNVSVTPKRGTVAGTANSKTFRF